MSIFMLDESSFENFLVNVAANLDIPEYYFKEAVDKYEDVAEWLGEEGSNLLSFSPEAYVQGSFRLGTMIKPTSEDDHYDIDFVCKLTINKDSISKKELKNIIGDQLKKRTDLKKIISEKGRCWTLNYSDIFHIDILPAIPDVEKTPNGILLTDRELHHWQKSNPKDYADWFYGKMMTQLNDRKKILAKSEGIHVEDIKDWQVRTPLQQAIQILKRHRDVYFDRNPGEKPASVIITTISAMVYNYELSIKETLIYLIRNMDKQIKKDASGYVLKNPVADENFTDKWNDDNKKAFLFYEWIKDLSGAFLSALEENNHYKLEPLLGEKLIRKSNSLTSQSLMKSAMLPPGFTVPDLGDISHCLVPSWKNSQRYDAKVYCDVFNKSKKKYLYKLVSGKFVPREKSLKFTVVTNTPGSYEVKWQVANTGAEAAGKLRGDFYNSDEGTRNARWETTSYVGTHFVEAFIIQDDQIVAKSGKFYIKIRNSFF